MGIAQRIRASCRTWGCDRKRCTAVTPAINDRELAELIDISPKLPILDVGLITADERIATHVAELREAHGDKLAPSNTSLAILMIAFLVVPAVTLAVFWLL